MTLPGAGALEGVGILDATLREGEQAPGVYFEPYVKAAIAGLLDEIGVEVIEAGHPFVDDEIAEAVNCLARRGFRARIAAHARARREDVEAALASGAGFLGIFLCVSPERLRERGLTPATALDQVTAAITLAKERRPGLIVRFTPEDAVRSPVADVAAVAAAAVAAGADIISIADTTGCMIPGGPRSLYDWLSRFRDELQRRNARPRLAVHCHNDRGLALANALDGLRAGASLVDVSVLGLGERAGIVDLAALLAVLVQDFSGNGRWRLEKVAELYRLVSRFSGVPIPVHFPVMGRNAFRHCAGVHSQAALRDPRHYQSLDPAPFGLSPEFSLDHMSGCSALLHALESIAVGDLDPELFTAVLRRVKAIGKKGRTVGRDELGWIVAWEKAQAQGRPVLLTQSA
jgi:2-isopropylmalate synthase